MVALHIAFAHEGCQTQRNTDAANQHQEGHRRAKGYRGKRQGIRPTKLPHHHRIGQLRKHLPHLRQHDGNRKLQIQPILRTIATPELLHDLQENYFSGNP